MKLRVDPDALSELRCRFPTCPAAPVAIFHVPEGCNCWRDPVQALCAQHELTVHSTGPVSILLDFRQPVRSRLR
jgi:hypothetical protein